MDADAILTSLGSSGRFQWLIFFAMSFIYMRGAWPVLVILFIGGDPGHHCKIGANMTKEDSIPIAKDGSYEQCLLYNEENQTTSCQQGWTYGNEFDSTILSEWDLVCDKSYLVDLSSTIYMAGSAAGALLLTPVADVFGRKRIVLSMLFIQGAIGFGTAFVGNYIFFTVLRFFIGLLNMPIALTVYNVIAEMFPATHRSYPAVGINCSWGIGIMILAAFGYFIREWRILQIVTSLPNFITILYCCFLPETIPWLIAKKKYAKAEKTAKFAAKINGKSLPNSLFTVQEEVKSGEESAEGEVAGQSSVRLTGIGETRVYTVLDLFKTPKLRRYTLIMFYLWLADSLSYFGVLFATPSLHGNQFLNLGISGAVEIPALIICMFAIDLIGRKKPMVFFLLLCGVMNIATIFVPDKTDSGTDLTPLQITLAMLGKFGISGAYSISYLYSSEIFPTVIRNHAVGLSSTFENLGSIAAPLIVYSTSTLTNLPLVLFGVLTIIGAFLALFLPETHKRPLPETIEDIENFRYVATQTEETRL